LFSLHAYSQPEHSSRKRFSLLPPSHTHISFNNQLRDTREHNILIYSNYYGGAGVGVGDFNRDGLPDLYFAGNLVADQLYYNKGNMVFEEVSRQAGIVDDGGWSSGVVVADVNRDGWPDIYVTRELYDDKPQLRKNKLYLNNGDGTFTDMAEAYGIADSERTRHATFLDYDRDGDLDLFLCNQPPNPGDYSPYYKTELLQPQYRIKLYANEGNRFREVTKEAGLERTGFPNSVTASDLNGDGWTDLFIANDFWVGDWYFINNGDGTFTDKIHENVRHTAFSSMGIDAADLNNDGRLDVMVVDMVAEDNYRLKANMSGMNPRAFWKVVKEGGHYQYMFNMFYLNTGEGHFSDIAQMGGVASTDWSWSVLMADLDNDGWKDIYVTNGLMRDIRNNDALKAFRQRIESSVHAYLQNHPNPGEVTIWDIVDVEEALALTPSEKLSNYVFRNEGELRFSKHMQAWGLEEKSFSNGAAVADLDLDGDLDLVVNNVNDVAFVYQNHSAELGGAHYLRIVPVADQAPGQVFGTKIWVKSQAGQQFFELTNVRGMYSTSEAVAHFGLGQEEEAVQVRIRWPDGREQLLSQVAADQLLEVRYSEAQEVVPEPEKPVPTIFSAINAPRGLDYVHRENEFDDYRTQVLLPHKMSTFGPCLATGDVNGDGLDDLFAGGAAAQPAALYLQLPDGSFRPAANELFEADKLHEDLGATFFDADGDGDLDLYVVSGGNEFMPGSDAYQDRLYLNQGGGHFGRGELPDMRQSGSKVYAADVDADGDMDLFVAGRHKVWAYPEPASSSLLLNQGGTFVDATDDMAPELRDIGMVNDAAWTDYDQDGWPDLVLLGEWMPLTLLKNEQGKALRKADLPEFRNTRGWWFSLTAADLDGDGDEDLLAGNLGLNYKYKASESEPFGVYYKDFDGNGTKDVVLTYYNYGIEYPLRGRQCSSEQVPQIKEKFKTYSAFASSDVYDIYGKNELRDALHYEATTFASMYAENLGNGHFALRPLPRIAQLSAVNDFIVADFNLDGHADVLLAGNLYDAEVETARNDAGYGLLMLGKGGGTLAPLDRMESGFFVPENVKCLTLLRQANGRQMVLAGINNGKLAAFQVLQARAR